jgi:hypothetical protein
MSQPASSIEEPIGETLRLRPLEDVLPPESGAGDLVVIHKYAAKQGIDYLLAAKRLARDVDANPLAFADAMDTCTHRAWRDWESETIAQFLGLEEDDVRALDLAMAVQVGITNPDVFNDWTLFHHCAVVFNHRRANFQWMDALTVLEAAWACCVLRALNQREQFGSAVLQYLTGLCLEQGLLFFPWIGGNGLDIPAQPWVRKQLTPEAEEMAKKLEQLWPRIAHLEPSEVDPSNAEHAQLAQLLRAQAYIRAQQPREPAHA